MGTLFLKLSLPVLQQKKPALSVCCVFVYSMFCDVLFVFVRVIFTHGIHVTLVMVNGRTNLVVCFNKFPFLTIWNILIMSLSPWSREQFSRSTDTIGIAIGGVLFLKHSLEKIKAREFLRNCNGKLVEHLYFSDFSTQTKQV